MRLESGSHSPFRRPIKEDQPIDPQHRGPVVRRLLVSPLMLSHRRLLLDTGARRPDVCRKPCTSATPCTRRRRSPAQGPSADHQRVASHH